MPQLSEYLWKKPIQRVLVHHENSTLNITAMRLSPSRLCAMLVIPSISSMWPGAPNKRSLCSLQTTNSSTGQQRRPSLSTPQCQFEPPLSRNRPLHSPVDCCIRPSSACMNPTNQAKWQSHMIVLHMNIMQWWNGDRRDMCYPCSHDARLRKVAQVVFDIVDIMVASHPVKASS